MTRVQTLAEIRQLLESYGLSPRKSFGQNFLIDHNLIRTLIDAAEVGEGDLVLEVGPGTGSLTEALLDRGCTVIACEIDRGLARVMRDRLGDRARFSLIEADCLQSKKILAPAIVEALAVLEYLLGDSADDYDVQVWRGVALVEGRQYGSARQAFDQSAALNAGRPEAWYWRGTVEIRAGKPDEAVAFLEKARSSGSSNCSPHHGCSP